MKLEKNTGVLIGMLISENKGISSKTGKPYHMITLLTEAGIIKVSGSDSAPEFGVDASKVRKFNYYIGSWFETGNINLTSEVTGSVS